MKEFLREVARTFVAAAGDDLRHYCFVFPNRRSSLFFRKYLGQASGKPVFSPAMITINDLFSQLSGLRTIDKTSLLYRLYLVYSKHISSFTESFDEFIYWGDMVLNDFDDIDKYLVDARRLFTNMKDLKELDSGYDFLSERQREAIRSFWGNLNDFREGKNEQMFIEVWCHLYDIYTDFRKDLEEKGECYEGMSYRHVAESLSRKSDGSYGDIPESLSKYQKVVFVGLNALNNCEKSVLDRLREEQLADFYWDYYGSIIQNPDNKSSLFMGANVERYPSLYTLTGMENDEPRHIEVIGIPSNVGQVKYVNRILSGIAGDSPSEHSLFSTAIVLPDETLLQPLLNSIPGQIEKINVTMGYTLSNSNVSTFMSMIMELQRKIRLNGSAVSYYHTSVMNILSHPFIRKIAAEEVKSIRRDIISKNMIFIPPEILQGAPLLRLIFNPLPVLSLNKRENIKCVSKYQLDILEELQKDVEPLEREFIFHYYTCINRLSMLDIEMETDTYFRLLTQVVSSISIPFKGEPLAGLQIMGPLETRALDFENIIILSANEGTFPSKSVASSFIPYNLRKGFGLPTYEHLDSISAYHFYRSIYRAKNVYMLYDTRTAGMKTGEVSRYVKQLKYHHMVPLKEQFVAYNVPSIQPQTFIEVKKDQEMIGKLRENVKGYSASALSTYLNCPLQFYFRYVKGMKESEDVSEDVEANTFGSLFHYVMEQIYKPFENKDVSKSQLREIAGDSGKISSYISEAFGNVMQMTEITGKNKIIEALLERYVVQTLKYDEGLAPFRYLQAEKMYCGTVHIPSEDIPVCGIIDRMDLTDGQIRISDYKTGSVNIKYDNVEEMFDTDNPNRPYTAFQLAFYLLLYKKDAERKPGGKPVDVSGISLNVYSLKTLFTNNIPCFIMDNAGADVFEEKVVELLGTIYNIDIPFTSASDTKHCEYCSFKLICNR